MKTSANLFRTIRHALLRGVRHDEAGDAAIGAYDEMCRSALVGCGAALAIASGLPPPSVLAAAIAGFCAGSIIGLLLWSASPSLPEDPVLPPAPGQGRAPRGQRIRSR